MERQQGLTQTHQVRCGLWWTRSETRMMSIFVSYDATWPPAWVATSREPPRERADQLTIHHTLQHPIVTDRLSRKAGGDPAHAPRGLARHHPALGRPGSPR